jgi:hypothetical protein
MFSEDLPRWQALFRDNQVNLDRFREAGKRLWGIDMSGSPIPEMPSEKLLAMFQEIAFRILDQTKKALRLVDEDLEAADRAFEDGQQCSYSAENGLDPQPPGECHPESDCSSHSPEPEQRMPNTTSIDSPEESRLLVFLIAGAIFAAVVAFMLGVSYCSIFQISNRC